MTEAEARDHLRAMLSRFTCGGILMLLAELYSEDADRAADARVAAEYRRAEAALFVLGIGIDAIRPR